MAEKEKKKKEPSPKPRQGRLPEMEDPKIEEFHALAEQLFEHRRARLLHGKQEADLNEQLLKLMKKRGREKYNYNGMHLTIVPKKEFVRVKIDSKGVDE